MVTSLSPVNHEEITIGIFIDLKKAFDTINHELLLCKLERYGIRGTALSWLTSYLNNRKQYVNYNGTSSSLLDISCGVPQGSILGPVLFILYINDLCNVSQFLKFVLFADDTNIFASGYNINELCERINQELININIWFKVNKLSLNLSKTNFILSTKRNIADSQLKIHIEGVVITRVYECKFLGVIIDSKLNWHSHCALVKNKLLKCNAILMKASLFLNLIAMRTLYCSLFLPHINYCCEVWGITNKGTIDPLVKLQQRAVRIVSKVGKYEHTNSLFYKLKLFKFVDLVDLKEGIVMWTFWTFWPNSAISGGRIWSKLSKGTSTGQDLSFEPIHMSLRPSVAEKQPGKAHVPKNRYFGHFGQIWPFPVAESGQNFQKAHLKAKTFHLSLFTGPYDHPLQRNSLEKLKLRKTAILDILAKFGHFRWPNLAKTFKRHIYRPRPFI